LAIAYSNTDIDLYNTSISPASFYGTIYTNSNVK